MLFKGVISIKIKECVVAGLCICEVPGLPEIRVVSGAC